jgi:hypothetical protein
LKTDHAYYTKKSLKIPNGAIIIYRRRTDNTMAKRKKVQNIHIKTRRLYIKQKKKGLYIKVQEVCKTVYEPHRDKQNKQRTSY